MVTITSLRAAEPAYIFIVSFCWKTGGLIVDVDKNRDRKLARAGLRIGMKDFNNPHKHSFEETCQIEKGE